MLFSRKIIFIILELSHFLRSFKAWVIFWRNILRFSTFFNFFLGTHLNLFWRLWKLSSLRAAILFLSINFTRAIKAFDARSKLVFIGTKPYLFQLFLIRISFPPTFSIIGSWSWQSNEIKHLIATLLHGLRAAWNLPTINPKVTKSLWHVLNFLSGTQSSPFLLRLILS